MPTSHGTGALQDRPDARDYQWSEIGFAATPFDWNAGYDIEAVLQEALKDPNFRIKPKDQDGSGSCGGQAWATQDAVLEAITTGSFEERSAKYIYEQTFVYPGGSNGRDNCNILVKQGCAREAVLSSYDHGMPPSEAFMEKATITAKARLDAKSSRLLSYANVNTDIDTVAQAIRENSGVVLGIVGVNNGTWESDMPNPPADSAPAERWYHWVYAGKSKIINGKKCIGILNSWGNVGDNGWQWLSEDYFRTVLSDNSHGQTAIWSAWTHVFNAAVVPPSFVHNFVSELRYRQSGAEVVALQKALQSIGIFPETVPCTGYYGDITRASVLAFQVKFMVAPMTELLSLNGRVVGPQTRAQLNKLFSQ